jgi:AcrR family transcriptional regulator
MPLDLRRETPPRRRLPAEERERLIVEEAVRYFAEVGFEGQTRELARRLNISQPLLYRYFPTKEELVERVYHHVYLDRWKKEWGAALVDRARPLEARLKAFYRDYSRTILDRQGVRIFMFAGLRGVGINKRYLMLLRERLFVPVCGELRREFALPSPEVIPVQQREIDLVWGLHGVVFYLGIRCHIYGVLVPEALDAMIDAEVETFIGGVRHALSGLSFTGD